MSTANSELSYQGGGRVRLLTVRRSPRALRMRLTVDPRDGAVKLTLPARAGLKDALRWVESKRGWIEAALAALPEQPPLGHGASLPFEGREVRINWAEDAPRTIRLEDDLLLVGGPEVHVGPRVLRWLRAQAKARLEEATRTFAARANVAVGRVGIGDPRSRWGSCSPGGDIRYSWRLILMPPQVLEATAAHEVAHRLHMHHGPEFHAAVKTLLGRDPKAERAWLRANGGRIQAVGRG